DVKGNPTGEFGPARPITYAEIAKMALEASGDGQATGAFTVKNRRSRNHWAKGYVRVMEDLRASVYTDRLNIDTSASRGAVMQTIVEVLGITDQPPRPAAPAVTGSGALAGSGTALGGSGTSVTGSGSVAPPAAAVEIAPAITFSDLPKDHKHAEAIMLLVKKGVISGDTKKDGSPKGTVRPNAPINRAEVSKIFTKLIQLKFVK
ncbi:MAG: S-layer homology domain-containing protein, partial [Patescibacteria group bacterium]